MNILAIGPGLSTKLATKKKGQKILAFQGTFPNCHEKLGIIPDIWFSADPHAYIEGFEYLLKDERKDLLDMIILVPSYFNSSFAEYRRYCGTTPLMRIDNGWSVFMNLMKKVSEKYKIEEIKCTTTKYIKNNSQNFPDEDIFTDAAYYRFMHPEVIIGSIEFDSESVIGLRYHWGLENKLSSAVLPICYALGAKDIYILGFDMFGPRFYSDDDRHPWSDESQGKEMEKSLEIPLNILKKWLQWKELHGMSIYTSAPDNMSYLNRVLPFKEV
jgi:hypothetical protein